MSTATRDWPTKPLNEVAKIDRTSVPPDKIKDGSIYVGLENITGEGEFDEVREVANGELASNKFSFTPKHVLYGKLRPYLSKIARPDFSGICSTDILPVLAGHELDRDFLFYFLRRPEMVQFATTRSTGANLPRLSPNELAKFPVPLPTLDEQKRIATILNKADSIRRQRHQAADTLLKLRIATFLDLFGDPETNPKNWNKLKLGDLTKLQGGYAFKSKDYVLEGVSLVKISNVHHEFLKWDDKDSLPCQYEEQYSEFSLRAGDVVLALTRPIIKSLDSVKVARITKQDIPCLLNQRVGRFVIKSEDQLLGSYLLHFLYSASFKRSVEKICSVSLQPNMSTKQVENISIPVPPIELQGEFERALREIESCQLQSREGVKESDHLFGSLVQRAFKGKL